MLRKNKINRLLYSFTQNKGYCRTGIKNYSHSKAIGFTTSFLDKDFFSRTGMKSRYNSKTKWYYA